MNISGTYWAAVAIVIGGILKLFGVEIENNVIEGLVAGLAAVIIAYLNKKRENLNILGVKK